MQKNVNLCVDLKTVMQNDALLVEGQCYSGVLTRDSEDHYVFEESVNKGGRCPRNPKLFDGQYCSLVHMQNGKYQIHMKTINASAKNKQLPEEPITDVRCLQTITKAKLVKRADMFIRTYGEPLTFWVYNEELATMTERQAFR